MTSLVIRRAQESDVAGLTAMLGASFGIAAERWLPWTDGIGHDNLRVALADARIVGGLGLYRFGMYVHRRRVSMAGLAGVGVPADMRGHGVARRLVAHVLRELRDEGVALAALYATTATLYRSCGFEQAGALLRYAAPVGAIPAARSDLACAPVDLADHSVFHAMYAARAKAWTGHLDRSTVLWQRLVRAIDGPAYGYLFGDARSPEGYVIYAQKPADGLHHDILIRDAVTLTPGAAQRLLGLLAGLRSLARDVIWSGPASDPLVTLLPEPSVSVRSIDRWMLRIVDVAQALNERGYPRTTASVELQVTDDVLTENAGKYVLSVRDGVADVTRGGSGAMRLDVRALAAMYTGFAHPHALRAAGLLDGPNETVELLAELFAGHDAWCCDWF